MFQSPHFTLHELAQGVFAAIATPDGAASSNAGIIDLGDQTLVFDALETHIGAADLRAAAVHLTGRVPSHVIISHFHPDHWAGLQVFAGCTCIATHATCQAILPIAEEMQRIKLDPSELEQELQEKEARLATETDEYRCQYLKAAIARRRHTLASLPTLEPTTPDLTFAGKLVFHGSKRTAELVDTGLGHTASDCSLLLPSQRVAFIGDLGFFQAQPFMADCSPAEWVAQLEWLCSGDFDTFVPGHGPLGSRANLRLQIQYIQALESLVANIIAAGGSLEVALQQALPAPFNAWQKMDSRFEVNVRAAFARQDSN